MLLLHYRSSDLTGDPEVKLQVLRVVIQPQCGADIELQVSGRHPACRSRAVYFGGVSFRVMVPGARYFESERRSIAEGDSQADNATERQVSAMAILIRRRVDFRRELQVQRRA